MTTFTLSDHSDVPCHKLMKFTVDKKMKICSFTYCDHTMGCDHHNHHHDDGINYGLRLLLGGAIIYECRTKSNEMEIQSMILEPGKIYFLQT